MLCYREINDNHQIQPYCSHWPHLYLELTDFSNHCIGIFFSSITKKIERSHKLADIPSVVIAENYACAATCRCTIKIKIAKNSACYAEDKNEESDRECKWNRNLTGVTFCFLGGKVHRCSLPPNFPREDLCKQEWEMLHLELVKAGSFSPLRCSRSLWLGRGLKRLWNVSYPHDWRRSNPTPSPTLPTTTKKS